MMGYVLGYRQWLALALIGLVLALDIGSFFAGYPERLLNPALFGVLCLAFLIGFGERVTRLVLSPHTGLTLEQSVERFEATGDLIELVRQGPSTVYVRRLLEAIANADVWSRLIVYRLLLRSLLRTACAREGLPLGDATGLSEMLPMLRERGVVEPELADKLNWIRQHTYFAEWGTGERPDVHVTKALLREAPTSLTLLAERLEERGRSISTDR